MVRDGFEVNGFFYWFEMVLKRTAMIRTAPGLYVGVVFRLQCHIPSFMDPVSALFDELHSLVLPKWLNGSHQSPNRGLFFRVVTV